MIIPHLKNYKADLLLLQKFLVRRGHHDVFRNLIMQQLLYTTLCISWEQSMNIDASSTWPTYSQLTSSSALQTFPWWINREKKQFSYIHDLTLVVKTNTNVLSHTFSELLWIKWKSSSNTIKRYDYWIITTIYTDLQGEGKKCYRSDI